MRALNVQGVNVTIPHKEAVCPLLDDIDEAAQLIGAVNTIVNQNGRLVGYNTDGIGLIRSLQADLDFECSPATRVVVFGAGGAARAAIVALAQQQVKQICIVNRTVARAQELVDLYRPHFPATDFSAAPFDEKLLISFFEKCELIINSTSIGLSGESFNVVAWPVLKKRCAIYDMVYSPNGTPLVRDAKAAGFRACYGLGMLAAQGEEAFRLWTGEYPDGVMRVALDSYLAAL
ncbi:MAG: shikimate dehydrogenase [Desulfobacteraceae bacterium 4572_35.2]|nr:MAG: shikimate dehydrogenase [Desulfobacteraceae bacterium 4572_35.2]